MILELLLALTLNAGSAQAQNRLQSIEDLLSTIDESVTHTSNLGSVGRPQTRAHCELEARRFRSNPATPAELAEWARRGFSNPNVRFVDFRSLNMQATHEFDLTVFVGPQWPAEEIERAIPLVSKIYEQCGIRVGQVRFVESGMPYRYLNPTEEQQNYIAHSVPDEASRPALFFVGPDPQRPNNLAHVWDDASGVGKTKHTAWFTTNLRTSNYRVFHNNPIALGVAHEMAHLFMNEGKDPRGNGNHEPPGVQNILGARGEDVQPIITPAQCTRMQSHRRVRSLR